MGRGPDGRVRADVEGEVGLGGRAVGGEARGLGAEYLGPVEERGVFVVGRAVGGVEVEHDEDVGGIVRLGFEGDSGR